jgi:WD40 repeat protein
MSKQNNEQKGRRKPRGRRFTVYGSQVDQATPSVVSTPPPQEIPYISDNTVERLHDMTEDIMALATMQMDFSSRQPYKLKRPVRLASRDMLREWDMRLEHRRLRDQDDTVAYSNQKQQNNSSPIHPNGANGANGTNGTNGATSPNTFKTLNRSNSPCSPGSPRSPYGNRSPRHAGYHAYRHAKDGHIRKANFTYTYDLQQEKTDEDEDNYNPENANAHLHVSHLPTLQEKLEERRREKTKRAPAPMVQELVVRERKKQREQSLRKKGNGTNGDGTTSATGEANDQNQIGDFYLDREGQVPTRSNRQTKMMVSPPMDGENAGTIVGTFMDQDKDTKNHYVEKRSWYNMSQKYRPTSAIDQSKEKISKYLRCEHVYGFSGQNTRNNLIYSGDGAVVYTAATLGVVINASTRRQKFMSGHTDTIISLASSHVRLKKGSYSYVATGEIGRNPKIIIWETGSMQPTQTLVGVHKRGIAQLAFSPSGVLLASIGLDKNHTLIIHEWKTGIELSKTPTGTNQIYGLKFQPDVSNPSDDTRLVTCGNNHLTFWNRPNTALESNTARSTSSTSSTSSTTTNNMKKTPQIPIKSRAAIFSCGKFNKNISILDICFDAAGRIIGGSNLGHLCIWLPKDNNSTMLPLKNAGTCSIKHAHKCPINSVETVPGGSRIVSGGVNGMIKIWTTPKNLHHAVKLYRSFDTIKQTQNIPSIQSISVAENKVRALIGTRGGTVIEMKLSDGGILKKKPLATGHHVGELWGLASHPSNPDVFVTGGDDQTVRMWSIAQKVCTATSDSNAIPGICRAMAFSPVGDYVVVGMGGNNANDEPNQPLLGQKQKKVHRHAGKIVILDGTTLNQLNVLKVATNSVNDVKFSTDGRTLAVASSDTFIYLMSVSAPTTMILRCKCSGHTQYITNVSMSNDGNYMLSNDGCGEIKYWNVLDGTEATDIEQIKRSDWSGNTCPLSWSTVGIYPNKGKLTDINTVCEKNGMMVTGDEFGQVHLYNAPSVSFNAPFMLHGGHSAHVKKVVFNANGKRVISIGGADRCAFVWKVVRTNEAELSAIKMQRLIRGYKARKELSKQTKKKKEIQRKKKEEQERLEKERAEKEKEKARQEEEERQRKQAQQEKEDRQRIEQERKQKQAQQEKEERERIQQEQEQKKIQQDRENCERIENERKQKQAQQDTEDRQRMEQERKQKQAQQDKEDRQRIEQERQQKKAQQEERDRKKKELDAAKAKEASAAAAATPSNKNAANGKKVVTAVHDYVEDEDSDLGFKSGQTIVVTDDSDEGWWVGYIESKGPTSHTGHFPANYVQARDGGTAIVAAVTPSNENAADGKKVVTAVHDYVEDEDSDLGFKSGETIVVTDDSDEGWWVGYIESKGPTSHTGHFPANYVE